MSELNMSYNEVFFEIPFNHLIFLMSSINPDFKENEIKANNTVVEKKYRNKTVPQFNF